jgi:hypothetical protein
MADGLASRYSRLVHQTSGWWGTFPVPQQLRVGDYVQMSEDGEIRYLGSVLNRPEWREGLPTEAFAYKTAERFSAHATTTRGGGGGAGVKAAGVGADASLTITFTEKAGFILNIDGTSGSRFRSPDTACSWILGAAKAGEWQEEAALITEVIRAERTTALVAEESGTSFRLETSASVPLDLTVVNLANPALHVDYSRESGSGYSMAQTEATPLYHCARIRRRWYGARYAELQSATDPDLGDVFVDSPFLEGDDDDAGHGSDV